MLLNIIVINAEYVTISKNASMRIINSTAKHGTKVEVQAMSLCKSSGSTKTKILSKSLIGYLESDVEAVFNNPLSLKSIGISKFIMGKNKVRTTDSLDLKTVEKYQKGNIVSGELIIGKNHLLQINKRSLINNQYNDKDITLNIGDQIISDYIICQIPSNISCVLLSTMTISTNDTPQYQENNTSPIFVREMPNIESYFMIGIIIICVVLIILISTLLYFYFSE